MNEENKHTGGWDFQSGDNDSSDTGYDVESSTTGEDREQFGWIRNNFRSMFGITAVVAAFLTVLMFAPNSSSTPSYDIPGGEIKEVSPDQRDAWLDVTDQLTRQLTEEHRPVNPGGGLLTFYNVLGNREGIKRLVSDICKEEGLTFEMYRDITHEFALTSPFKTIDEDAFEANQNEVNASSEKLRRIQKNREVLSEKFERFKSIWNKLHEGDQASGSPD